VGLSGFSVSLPLFLARSLARSLERRPLSRLAPKRASFVLFLFPLSAPLSASSPPPRSPPPPAAHALFSLPSGGSFLPVALARSHERLVRPTSARIPESGRERSHARAHGPRTHWHTSRVRLPPLLLPPPLPPHVCGESAREQEAWAGVGVTLAECLWGNRCMCIAAVRRKRGSARARVATIGESHFPSIPFAFARKASPRIVTAMLEKNEEKRAK